MTREDKQLLLKDLCARLPYNVLVHIYDIDVCDYDNYLCEDYLCKFRNNFIRIKPYLRPMSSMTEEEKKELLCVIVGKDAVKYFQVLSDGSIDNTDAAHQDLHNFTMHWINFGVSNTTPYIDWLNSHLFDYRGLIEKGLAIEVTKENNPYENNN